MGASKNKPPPKKHPMIFQTPGQLIFQMSDLTISGYLRPTVTHLPLICHRASIFLAGVEQHLKAQTTESQSACHLIEADQAGPRPARPSDEIVTMEAETLLFLRSTVDCNLCPLAVFRHVGQSTVSLRLQGLWGGFTVEGLVCFSH